MRNRVLAFFAAFLCLCAVAVAQQGPVLTSEMTTRLASYVPITRTVNGQALSGNVTITNATLGNLRGATASIGGGALTGECASGTATVTGAATGAHHVTASPSVDITTAGTVPFSIHAYVSATNTVTVLVCGTGTPTATTYNVLYTP